MRKRLKKKAFKKCLNKYVLKAEEIYKARMDWFMKGDIQPNPDNFQGLAGRLNL